MEVRREEGAAGGERACVAGQSYQWAGEGVAGMPGDGRVRVQVYRRKQERCWNFVNLVSRFKDIFVCRFVTDLKQELQLTKLNDVKAAKLYV